MGPSIAGRGKPRPLLAGVFRKACDYCVRSKRGCNGGKPCEQCTRRGHSCTYSQRRKSGPRSPRSRPLRPQQQQQQEQQHSPARLGTRSSAQRTVVSLASCPSPSRTASLSSSSFSSSSPSESSDGGDDSSDDESDMEEQQRPREQKQQQQKQRQKRCRISGPEAAGGEGISVAAQQVLSPVPVSRQADDQPPSPSPSPFISAKASPRGDASAADAAAGPAAEHVVEPQAAEPAVSSSPASSPSSRSPPRQLSPLTVGALPTFPLNLQRSSSLPSWAREASGDAQQQQQQQQQQTHRSSASVGAVPTSTSIITTDNNKRGDTSVGRVNQITMLPWEEGRPRSVTLINVATQQQQQQQQQAQAYQVPAFAVPSSRGRVFVSKHSGQRSMPSPDPLGAPTQQQTAAAASSALSTSMMLDGAGDFGGGALKDLEEDDDFACCPWRIPSLTRQGSLARVVAALGAERSVSSMHGVEIGFGGSFATAW